MGVDVIRRRLVCPGTADDAVRLTNEFTTQYGIGHPTNTGDCTLYLVATDSLGWMLDEVELSPGDSRDWYYAPAHSVAIRVVCQRGCAGRGEFTFDAPVA